MLFYIFDITNTWNVQQMLKYKHEYWENVVSEGDIDLYTNI